jgi:hypothetical protein
VVEKLDMVFAATGIFVQIEHAKTGSCGSEQNAAAFVLKKAAHE